MVHNININYDDLERFVCGNSGWIELEPECLGKRKRDDDGDEISELSVVGGDRKRRKRVTFLLPVNTYKNPNTGFKLRASRSRKRARKLQRLCQEREYLVESISEYSKSKSLRFLAVNTANKLLLVEESLCILQGK